MLFPKSYSKPGLIGIVDAAGIGWGAICSDGGAPGTGGLTCGNGPTDGAKLGGNKLYTNPDNSSRLLNPDDVGNGF